MYPELHGKRALVTGGSRGFGRAIALRLASEGVQIIVNFRRSKTEAMAVVEEIKQLGGDAIAFRGDVGSQDSLDRLFESIHAQFDSLDILVANAAFGIPGPLMSTTPKHWDITMESSAHSFLSLVQRTAPMMNGGWGRIVSITSAGGERVLPGYGLMGIAKSALESLTRVLAAELAGSGILVNGVHAGVSDTKSLRSVPGVDDLLRLTAERTPVGRAVTAEDVADVVAFLVSNQARMICGQFVVVDGGFNVLA